MIIIRRAKAVLTSAVISSLLITGACNPESSDADGQTDPGRDLEAADSNAGSETGPEDRDSDSADAPVNSASADFDFVRSGLGESCLVTAHCDEELGLLCVDNTCVSPTRSASDAGAESSAPARLGQVGESCRARRDCELNLGCIRNTCVPLDDVDTSETPGQDAGTGSADVSLVSGQVGESCTSRADCAPGLACFSGRCAQGSSGLEPTGKECVLIECREAVDCCPTPLSSCPTYEAECLANPGSTYCTTFEQNCVCDGSDYDCSANQCVYVQCREPVDCCPLPPTSCATYEAECEIDPASEYCTIFEQNCVCDGSTYECANNTCSARRACTSDTNCLSTQVCDVEAGFCVGCLLDTDCPQGATCAGNVCTAGCERDEECPIFNQCIDAQCVDVGCQTDRECKVYTGDIQAVCEDGECQVQCASDFECAENMVCVNNACVAAGCETDEECRLQFANSGLTTTFEIECKAVP